MADASGNWTFTTAPLSQGQHSVSATARDAEADLTLDGGTAPQGVASTIVGTSGEAPLILRGGAISRRAIEEALS